jgi:hypothetical protein
VPLCQLAEGIVPRLQVTVEVPMQLPWLGVAWAAMRRSNWSVARRRGYSLPRGQQGSLRPRSRLTKPWYVARNELDTVKRQLEIGIDFERDGTFSLSGGQAGCKACDTEERRWRHLNFFQFETVLSARVPHIDCGSCGKWPVQVPWARPGSGFTLLARRVLNTYFR